MKAIALLHFYSGDNFLAQCLTRPVDFSDLETIGSAVNKLNDDPTFIKTGYLGQDAKEYLNLPLPHLKVRDPVIVVRVMQIILLP